MDTGTCYVERPCFLSDHRDLKGANALLVGGHVEDGDNQVNEDRVVFAALFVKVAACEKGPSGYVSSQQHSGISCCIARTRLGVQGLGFTTCG